MRKPSLKAFERVKKNLTPRQQMVATKAFKRPGSTGRDISKAMGVPAHTISGRITELEALGILKDIGWKYYKGSSQPHTKWEVTIK